MQFTLRRIDRNDTIRSNDVDEMAIIIVVLDLVRSSSAFLVHLSRWNRSSCWCSVWRWFWPQLCYDAIGDVGLVWCLFCFAVARFGGAAVRRFLP